MAEESRQEETEEKVSLSPIASIPANVSFVGRVESTSGAEAIRECAQGLTFVYHLRVGFLRLLRRLLETQNVLPLYGVYIPRTLPPRSSNGRIDVVTNIPLRWITSRFTISTGAPPTPQYSNRLGTRAPVHTQATPPSYLYE